MNASANSALATSGRAALYLRVSTGRQAEHDLSIPDQRRQLQAYCHAKGLSVAMEFVEPGASATDDKRPEFQEMMDAASQHPAPFDTIVVHSFSRFFRDQFQLEFYVRRLAKNGVRLTSITQDLGDDPMSTMMRQIMALFDEYQSKENAKHTLRAMRENARQGYWNGSRPPYGYRIVAAEQRGARTKKKIEPDPLTADNVRLMFRLARAGDSHNGPMGVRQIASYLNNRGIRTQTGGRWGLGGVHQVLTRMTYIGRHRFNVSGKRKGVEKAAEDIVEVAVKPIIEEHEFNTVQDLLKSRSPQLRPPRFVSSPMLLGGVVFCEDCGGAMTLRTSGKGKQYRYYTCSTAARQGPSGCKGRTMPMEKLNNLVASYVERRLLNPDRLEELLSGLLRRRAEQDNREKDRVGDLRRQAADAEGKLTRLYEAIEDGLADLSDSNLKTRISELKRTRDAANADAERAESRKIQAVEITQEAVARFAEGAKRKLRDENGSFRRHHLQTLVQRVDVGTDRILIKGSKATLFQTLIASKGTRGVCTVGNDVRSFVLKWLPGPDNFVKSNLGEQGPESHYFSVA
ncbi:recombinase family protein [Mesorhizobium sp. 131-2-1]|uniref:recombinase family protein n=1 Tax=Mesorhizobium sp. 131-2-1 TaxID=2744518 RepID=UPI0019272768|nr:recombinase family protein [Mesorhizobium sp. 131-2-1]BCG94168.1 recombinase [Mesorhizobium sp. 131-2-1]